MGQDLSPSLFAMGKSNHVGTKSLPHIYEKVSMEIRK